MNTTRLIRKIWSCMFFALRMLTLVTFTAHAVLGCCLSHGNCMREQAAVLTSHCCDHNDHAGAVQDSHDDAEHPHDAKHRHQAAELDTSPDSASIGFVCPLENHGHSNHCDDGKCVFGLSGNTNGSGLQFAIVVSWIDSSVSFWRWPASHATFLGAWLDGPPRIHLERAVLQVWLI